MIGYLKPKFDKPSKDCKREYKSFYCGLCKTLKKRYSYTGILSLNYETTAFLILLKSLEETKQQTFHGSCSISPFVPVTYIDYYQDELKCAADLSMLILHYEISDNKKDIGGIKWDITEKIISKKIAQSKESLQDSFFNIENAISKYYQIENSQTTKFEDVLEGSGNLTKAIFLSLIKNHDVTTTNLLLELSSLLGKWIYLIDACDDLEKDKKSEAFNPILIIQSPINVLKFLEAIEIKIAQIIEELPIVNYKELVNIVFVDSLRKTRIEVTKNLNT